MAMLNKINDKDDFIKLNLKKYNGTEEVDFIRDSMGYMVCKSSEGCSQLQEDKVFDRIESFIQKGFRNIICQCWSGDVHIQVPDEGHSKLKITYNKPNTELNIDNTRNLIEIGEASDLLKSIEIMSNDGYISADMQRKYVQIDNFIKLVYPMLVKSTQKGKIFILDCGSGKSYLSFVMNYFIREKLRRNCHFYCIDTNQDIMEKCLWIRDELGYDNMEFHTNKIRDFQTHEKIDIVCSLHACDTASDEAIAKGIKLMAQFMLIVPCCQSEVINQLTFHPLKAITRHGVYNARLADILTDGLRTLILEATGYKVRVKEYVSPIYTPKNIIIQAEKIQNKNKMAMKQYMELKATFSNISIELERMLPELFSSSD